MKTLHSLSTFETFIRELNKEHNLKKILILYAVVLFHYYLIDSSIDYSTSMPQESLEINETINGVDVSLILDTLRDNCNGYSEEACVETITTLTQILKLMQDGLQCDGFKANWKTIDIIDMLIEELEECKNYPCYENYKAKFGGIFRRVIYKAFNITMNAPGCGYLHVDYNLPTLISTLGAWNV